LPLFSDDTWLYKRAAIVNSSSDVTADLEVVVFAHNEEHFLGGCITSVMRACEYAEANGRSVVLTVVVRAATPLTSAWVSQRLSSRWQVLNCPDLTLGQARNLARLATTGQNVAFIDGYDLLCETWLDRAADAASREPAVWRPEALVTFGNDFHSSAGYSVIFQPLRLDHADVFLSHQSLVSGFVAPRDILLEHPWPDVDAERGWDSPDHWWNCDVAAAGHQHRALPETFHYRRMPGTDVEVPSLSRGSPKIRVGPTSLARCVPKSAPLLSFIVLSYNYQHYIGTTIRSILNQTVQDFEIVVVDDASTDASREVVRDFGDSRIRLLVNERNLGGAGSYNVAVQAARGEWLVNLDADDWIAPQKSEVQLEAASRDPALDVIGTWVRYIGADGAPHPEATSFEHALNSDHKFNLVESWIGLNYLCRSSTMVKRVTHLRIGLDDPGMVRAPDYELWTRALAAGCRFGLVQEPLTYYRLHAGGVTRGDPAGTLLEIGYAMARNLAPLAERRALFDDLASIVRWIATNRDLILLTPQQALRLIGTLVTRPPLTSFLAFRAALAALEADPTLERIGRFALLGMGGR
jgi:glycosyltransferase involved in cell wall biosynthesis